MDWQRILTACFQPKTDLLAAAVAGREDLAFLQRELVGGAVGLTVNDAIDAGDGSRLSRLEGGATGCRSRHDDGAFQGRNSRD